VGIIFSESVGMNEVRGDSVIAKRSAYVVDSILRIDEISSRKAFHFPPISPPGSNVLLRLAAVRRCLNWPLSGGCIGKNQRTNESRFCNEAFRRVARIVAEVGRFVHVNPESINVDSSAFIEERTKLTVPVCLRLVVEPIGICGGSWPNYPSID
jgi:hypothetical protein